MVVNPWKTQLLCVAPGASSEVLSFVDPPQGDRIECSDNMILLGFSFSNRPNVSSHVKLIKKKVNCRL